MAVGARLGEWLRFKGMPLKPDLPLAAPGLRRALAYSPRAPGSGSPTWRPSQRVRQARPRQISSTQSSPYQNHTSGALACS
jgi:hypothetical protein